MTDFSTFKRLVIKVGSALLVDYESGTLRSNWLSSLVEDIARLKKQGLDIIVVSSGSIALGRQMLSLPHGVLKLEESQAAASVGQVALAPAWAKFLEYHDIKTGQILLTLEDTEARRRYLNARATLETLLKYGAVPVINENDTVATAEIRYGDNDRLAARVAMMAGADCLVLLSDIDGLYDCPPSQNPDARHIDIVEAITPEIEAMAGISGTTFASGGMITKIAAAKMAIKSGTSMIIASGREDHPLSAIQEGARHTLFLASENPVAARKRWILGHLQATGTLILDEGAVQALLKGNSLLPAGVSHIDGFFQRGDAVCLLTASGEEIGRGLVSYDFNEAQKIIGQKSSDIESLLGYVGRSAMVHRDDMALHDRNDYNAL